VIEIAFSSGATVYASRHSFHLTCEIEPMGIDPVSMLTFCAGAVLAFTRTNTSTQREVQRQQEVMKRGVQTQGTITAVRRAPLFGFVTGVYFEFSPSGSDTPIRVCHVERRHATESMASMPSVGTSVRVSYLPENPKSAVISKLVSRLHYD
jgi:hypothetical protein